MSRTKLCCAVIWNGFFIIFGNERISLAVWSYSKTWNLGKDTTVGINWQAKNEVLKNSVMNPIYCMVVTTINISTWVNKHSNLENGWNMAEIKKKKNRLGNVISRNWSVSVFSHSCVKVAVSLIAAMWEWVRKWFLLPFFFLYASSVNV